VHLGVLAATGLYVWKVNLRKQKILKDGVYKHGQMLEVHGGWVVDEALAAVVLAGSNKTLCYHAASQLLAHVLNLMSNLNQLQAFKRMFDV
jgi:hypothetical protein